jgi:hypothetical protein
MGEDTNYIHPICMTYIKLSQEETKCIQKHVFEIKNNNLCPQTHHHLTKPHMRGLQSCPSDISFLLSHVLQLETLKMVCGGMNFISTILYGKLPSVKSSSDINFKTQEPIKC